MEELTDFYIKNFDSLSQKCRRIARWYHLRNLEEDIAQDVFFKIQMLKPSKIKDPRAYIAVAFANKCRSILRLKKEENYGVFPDETLFLEEKNPLSEFIQQENFERLKRRVEGLKLSDKVAIEFRYFEQLPYEECAELLHVTITNARKKVYRGVKELRRVYGYKTE